MRMIKSAIRKPQLILQQLGNRVDEGFFHCKQEEKPCGVYKEHCCGPVVGGLIHCRQYREVKLTDFALTVTSGDNCVRFGSAIGLESNIFSDGTNITLIVLKFRRIKEFFTSPLKSSKLGIYKVSKLSKILEICSLSAISTKYVLMPDKSDGKWIAIPLNHSFM